MTRQLFALFLCTAMLIAACSGDNGTAPPTDDDDDDGGGGTVTSADTLRLLTTNAVAAQLDQWAGLPADTIATRAVAFLETRSNIKDAGITQGSTTVWAVFKDGVSLIIPNNRETSTAADTLIDAAIVSTPNLTAAPRRTIPAGRDMVRAMRVPESALEIPVSAKFRALNPIGTCHVDPLPMVKKLLRAGHYVNAGGSATVEGLALVQGDGVFYINTHGGVGFDGNAVPYYALWTATPFDAITFGLYTDMLKAGELAVVVEMTNDAQGNCVNLAHLGITAIFVKKYMSFGKNSLVILDACDSGKSSAASMREAFKAKGASVVVGWTDRITAGFAYASTKYLLDRLLGVNIVSPENPKQRAFNIDQVRADMAKKNLVDDPVHHAVLTVFHLRDDFGLLAPTIQFVSLEENGLRGRLFIAGIFGTDPGEGNRSVTINGQPLDNIEWYPTEIDCDIPDTGSNASGTIVVKVGTGANARESNPVNITEWKGDLIYERDDPGSHTAQMTLTVRFRADIHDFRDEPGEPPFKTQVLFTASDDSKIEITSGGVFSETFANCTDTYTLGNNGSAKSPFVPGTEGSWIYFGSVDTQSHKLRLIMQVLAVWKAGTWKKSGDCENFEKPLYAQLAIEDCLFNDLNQTTAFSMDMNNDFEVLADQRGPCSVDPMVSNLAGDHEGQAKIRWNDITPFFLPDPDAAR